jgi:hypothetical protein
MVNFFTYNKSASDDFAEIQTKPWKVAKVNNGENIVTKGDSAQNKQYLMLSCFQKLSAALPQYGGLHDVQLKHLYST